VTERESAVDRDRELRPQTRGRGLVGRDTRTLRPLSVDLAAPAPGAGAARHRVRPRRQPLARWCAQRPASLPRSQRSLRLGRASA